MEYCENNSLYDYLVDYTTFMSEEPIGEDRVSEHAAFTILNKLIDALCTLEELSNILLIKRLLTGILRGRIFF